MASVPLERPLASALLSLPPSWLRRLSGGVPLSIDGHELDAQVQLIATLEKVFGAPKPWTVPLHVARRGFLRNTAIVDYPRRAWVESTDSHAHGPAGRIPVRIFRPRGLASPAPALVYFHGGGWVFGDLDSHDGVCRVLADEASAVVIAVDYRLAPEHRFPAAVDDALAAFRWVVTNANALGLDRARIAVGGDSAGGNLAAVVSQACRAQPERGAPCFQLLVYPATDMTCSQPSHRTCADAPILDASTIRWFRSHYAPDERLWRDERVSPLLARDLTGLPPALVLTAGFDPLRDEGQAYAARLSEAGVTTRHHCLTSMPHGFWSMAGLIGGAREGMAEAAAALRAIFAR